MTSVDTVMQWTEDWLLASVVNRTIEPHCGHVPINKF